MNFYALTGLLNAVISSILGLFVFLKNRKSLVNRTFLLFCLTIAIWSSFYFLWQITTIQEKALFWSRALMAGAVFIPIGYLHFLFTLTNKIKEKKKFLNAGYLIFIFFFFSNFTPLLVKNVTPKLGFSFWPNPGILYHPFILIWLFCAFYSIYFLAKESATSTGIKQIQLKYIFIGTIIGYSGGITNYLLWYDIPIPPVGNWTVSLYLTIVVYAIIKYRFMDIRLVLGRGAVYLFSFVTIIALAFFLLFLNNKLFQPLSLNISGPVIIILSILLFQPISRFFEKLVSKYFYYTFYSYQRVLTSLGKRLTKVLELDKLTSLITNTLINTMKLDKTGILLREPETGDYKIQKILGFKEENGISLVRDNFLTLYLEKTKKPLVYEELTFAIRDNQDEKERANLEKLQSNMKRIEANICLPLFREDKITGIIVLGNKISGDPYSQQDLELLINLSNQASLSLENARLYQIVQDLSQNLEQKVKEQTKKIQALLEMKSEFLKVVTHQLNTPASIIKGMASMLFEGSIKGPKREEFIKKIYLSSERLTIILDDIFAAQSLVAGGEIVNLSPCQIEEIVEKKINQLKTQAEMKGLKISFERPKEPLPITLADSEMLERAIFKLIDNAILYTAKGEIKISLNLKKKEDKDFIEISVEDQGIGLDEEDKKNAFKLFYRGERATGLHPNGTGLGLFIVNEFIKMHKGEIKVESEGRGKGSNFTVTLPVITEL